MTRKRTLRRSRIDTLSIRPSPGTQESLHHTLTREVLSSPVNRAREVEVHDLTALAPIHLIEAKGLRVGKVESVLDLVWKG